RKDAIRRFAELGFPTTRLEEWKYTNVAPITRIPFQAAELRWDGVNDERLAELPLAHSAFTECCSRIVFINGHYSPQLSSSDIVERIIVGSLASAIQQNVPRIKEHIARSAAYQKNAIA